jgi:hypothetical protein
MISKSRSPAYAVLTALFALAACGGGGDAPASNLGASPAGGTAPAPAPVIAPAPAPGTSPAPTPPPVGNTVGISQLNACPYGSFNNVGGNTSNAWQCLVGRYAGSTADGTARPCTLEIASSGLITGTQEAVVTSFQFLAFTLSKRLLEPDALRNRVDYSMTFSFAADVNGETFGLIGGLRSLPATIGGPVQEEISSAITRGFVGGASSAPFSCLVIVP